MSVLNSIFETKGGEINRSIAKAYGGYARGNYQGYNTIVKEAYIYNFIINRCIREQAKALNKLNFVVKKHSKNEGESEYVENHDVEMLMRQPNEDYGGNELLKRSLIFWHVMGEIPYVFDLRTFGKDLYIYRPDRIYFDITGETGNNYQNIYYQTSINQPIEPDNFLMIKNFNPQDNFDGMGRGVSPLKSLFKELDTFNAVREYKLSILANGGNFSGVFVFNDEISEENFNRFASNIKQKYTGEKNVGKYGAFTQLEKFINTSGSPKDMDYIEGEKQLIKHLHAGMEVDPILTGYNDFSSYNNKKEASKELYTKFAIPFMRMLATELTMYFSKNKILKKGEFIDIDSSNVEELRENRKELIEVLEKNVALTENEKRVAQGKDEKPGLDLIVSSNYIYKNGETYIPMNFIKLGEEKPSDKSLFRHGKEGE